jgi:mannose-6-phosphate isomerase
MAELYPLLMKPYFDRRPWGARDLAPIYDVHVHPGEEPIGETWLTWDKCAVANGPLAGVLLGDLCKQFGRTLVGTAARETDRYPLLTKFLFPCDKLSVQVHPDDEAAKREGEPCGKTECWYVVKAEPGAQVGLGLKPGVTVCDFEQAIRETRAEDLLNWINLEAGEMIYVDAGTVHTLGAGSIIVETQQNSDTTYRLYDYGRPRELHMERGLAATRERTLAGKVEPASVRDGTSRLIETKCFVVEKHTLNGAQTFDNPGGRTAHNLVAIDGCGVVEAEGCEPVIFARGDAVVVPACVSSYKVRPQWSVEFLKSEVP